MQESIRKSIVDRSESMSRRNSRIGSGTPGKANNSPDLSLSASYPASSQEGSSKRSARSRSEEKGVYVAGMLKMGEKKLFIVVS